MGNRDSWYPWLRGSEVSPTSPEGPLAPREMRGRPPNPCLEMAGHTRCPQALQGGVQWDAHTQGPRFSFPSAAARISPSQAKPQLQSSLTSSGNGDTSSWHGGGCLKPKSRVQPLLQVPILGGVPPPCCTHQAGTLQIVSLPLPWLCRWGHLESLNGPG